MHGALDATAAVRARIGFGPADVERITVFAPQASIDMVLAPLADKHRPRSTYEAKFSAPFAIGALLEHDRVDVMTFREEGLDDADVLSIASKVDYEPREYATFPESFPAGVRVLLRDGSEHEEHVEHQLGAMRRPLAPGDVVAKFQQNAALGLPEPAVRELEAAVMTGSHDADLSPLQLLRTAAPR
jgi:2-methylcitrate dehydratase PrpD